MNTKLVQSLAQLILALSEEERMLLEAELKISSSWEYQLKKIEEHRISIYQKRDNKPFELSVDDIFEQMREERSQQLLY